MGVYCIVKFNFFGSLSYLKHIFLQAFPATQS